jgi:hypothetical protein
MELPPEAINLAPILLPPEYPVDGRAACVEAETRGGLPKLILGQGASGKGKKFHRGCRKGWWSGIGNIQA